MEEAPRQSVISRLISEFKNALAEPSASQAHLRNFQTMADDFKWYGILWNFRRGMTLIVVPRGSLRANTTDIDTEVPLPQTAG